MSKLPQKAISGSDILYMCALIYLYMYKYNYICIYVYLIKYNIYNIYVYMFLNICIQGKFYGDRYFIGDLGDHVCSAIKTL